MSKRQPWVLLAFLGLSAALGWWDRHPPAWIAEDPLSQPFGIDFLRTVADPGGTEDPTADRREKEVTTTPICVNRAAVAELCRLPRVGPVTAERIVEERRRGGPFRRPEDLLRVRGIGPKTLEVLRPLLCLEDSVARGDELSTD